MYALVYTTSDCSRFKHACLIKQKYLLPLSDINTFKHRKLKQTSSRSSDGQGQCQHTRFLSNRGLNKKSIGEFRIDGVDIQLHISKDTINGCLL